MGVFDEQIAKERAELEADPRYKGTVAAVQDKWAADQAEAEATGWDIGSNYQGGTGLAMTNAPAPHLETAAERYINQQQNYAYGGTPYGADEAVSAARAVALSGSGTLTDFAEGAQGISAGLQGTAGELRGTAASIAGRGGPMTDYELAQQTRANELAAYGGLMAAAQAPEGPSAAQAQLTAGTNQALASQLALARSGRGAGESASAMRNAAWNSAAIQQEAGNQAAILRAQEDQAFRQRQLQALGAAGGLAGQVRGADVGQAQFLTQAELQSRGLNDQTALAYEQAALGYQTAGLSGQELALQGYGDAVSTAMSGEQLANLIRMQQLEGTSGYETNLTNYMVGKRAEPDTSPNAMDWAKTGISVAGLGLSLGGGSDEKSSDIRAKQAINPLAPQAGGGLMPQRGGYQQFPNRLPPQPGTNPYARAAAPGMLTRAGVRPTFAQRIPPPQPQANPYGNHTAAQDAAATQQAVAAGATGKDFYAAKKAALEAMGVQSDIRAKQGIAPLPPAAAGGIMPGGFAQRTATPVMPPRVNPVTGQAMAPGQTVADQQRRAQVAAAAQARRGDLSALAANPAASAAPAMGETPEMAARRAAAMQARIARSPGMRQGAAAAGSVLSDKRAKTLEEKLNSLKENIAIGKAKGEADNAKAAGTPAATSAIQPTMSIVQPVASVNSAQTGGSPATASAIQSRVGTPVRPVSAVSTAPLYGPPTTEGNVTTRRLIPTDASRRGNVYSSLWGSGLEDANYSYGAQPVALSDKDAKEEVYRAGLKDGLALNPQPDLPTEVEQDAQDTINSAPGYSYQYRDPMAMGAAPGRHYGPMAQDLERTPMGRSVVSTGPDGMKAVDTDRLSLVNTAALNAQQKEIEQLKRMRARA